MQNDTKANKHHHIVNIQEKNEKMKKLSINHDYQEIKCRQDQEKTKNMMNNCKRTNKKRSKMSFIQSVGQLYLEIRAVHCT